MCVYIDICGELSLLDSARYALHIEDLRNWGNVALIG